MRAMRAELISIGTELAAGLIVDTNSAWLAGELSAVGILPVRHVTVTDSRQAIAEDIRRAAGAAEVVVATGGLGPTPDDLTRDALADAMGVSLRTDPEALRQIREFFARRSYPWTDSNARQAEFPEGTAPIPNAWGTAPGIRAEVGRAVVYCLPGVPDEMRQMFTEAVLPELRSRGGAGVVLTRTLPCFGAGESRIGEIIADLMEPGREVTVGTTAEAGVISVRFIVRAASEERARRLLDPVVAEVEGRLGHLVIGPEGTTLESAVGRLLGQGGLTIATAESCTGGLLAKRLTDVPGSSGYFLRGFVTYSNQAKVESLGVDPGLIERHGAVSAEVVEAMARGCRERSGTDFALATSGVAGPSGGTAAKPIGLVYIGLAGPQGGDFRELRLGGHLSRRLIRDRACSSALNLLRRRLPA